MNDPHHFVREFDDIEEAIFFSDGLEEGNTGHLSDIEIRCQPLHPRHFIVSWWNEDKENEEHQKAQEYVEQQGMICPNCGGRHTQGHEFTFELATVKQEVACNDCKALWNDIYILAGFDKVEGFK